MDNAKLRKPVAVLFDMGGVLLQSADTWDARQFPISFPDGVPEHAPLDWFLGMSGEIMNTFLAQPVPRPPMDVRPYIVKWLKEGGMRDDAATVMRWFNILCRWEAPPLFGFVHDALHRLCRMGYRLGLVSNTLMPGTYIRQRFAEGGILDVFETVVFSAEFGANKPDPSIFLHALATMGVTPENAWYVGDKPQRDVCGAHRAGMTAVLVDSRHAHRVDDAPESMPDVRVPNIAALPALLEGL